MRFQALFEGALPGWRHASQRAMRKRVAAYRLKNAGCAMARQQPAAAQPGATDSCFMRNAGIPMYGVSGTFSEPGDARAHGLDERVAIPRLYRGREFMHRMVKALSQQGPGAAVGPWTRPGPDARPD
jgi:acetylornithine deacetylase/succinyl-diaminopimelate desuccinylase-like protein